MRSLNALRTDAGTEAGGPRHRGHRQSDRQVRAGDARRRLPRRVSATDLNVTVGAVQGEGGLRARQLGGVQGARRSTAAAAHGDLVLTDTEINPVISALQQHNFEITALHNHLINESPSVMYLHFWGKGDAATLAQSVKDALSKSKTPMVRAGAAADRRRGGRFAGRSDSAGDRIEGHRDQRRARRCRSRGPRRFR